MTKKKLIECLAPMDGITDQAYRRIVRELNPDVIVYSEFTSIEGIKNNHEHFKQRLSFTKSEIPYFVQLFGNDPKLFAEISKELEDWGVSGIDINMGCPAKKIVASQHGSSLMKEADLACRIVEACSKAVQIPITVKTRLGWDDSDGLVDFISLLVNSGAQMITIHGRTYKQAYKGTANWNPIYNLKKHLSIPVIGNGDVISRDHALSVLGNLDGYMVGRNAIGNPWVFWNNEKQKTVPLKTRIKTMILHFQYLREYQKERRALLEFRKHLTGYISGFNEAKSARLFLMEAQSEQEFTQRALSLA
ncbi:MAG: tRNA-dihydrouridine synthase B [bacterium]|jgi:tRNA-dihydrouridine synthase B